MTKPRRRTGRRRLPDRHRRGRRRADRRPGPARPSWHSEPGCRPLLSVVLRPADLPRYPADPHPRARPRHGRGHRATTGIACDLRWPNDVLIGRQKVRGHPGPASGRRAIAGIGINVNHTSFPDDWRRSPPPCDRHRPRALARRSARLLSPPSTTTLKLSCARKDAILRAFTRASSYVARPARHRRHAGDEFSKAPRTDSTRAF